MRSAAAGAARSQSSSDRVEEGAQVPELAGRPALELAPARRDLPQRVDVGARAARPRSARARRGRCRSRSRAVARPAPGPPRAARPRTAGPRPSRRSACPTKLTIRSRDEVERRGARRRCPARRPSRRPGERRAAPGSGSRRRNVCTSTPGGPEPGALAAATARPPAPRTASSPVWCEPTSTPFAPRIPSSAYGRKRSGCGRTVYSSALPWIFTAYGDLARRARGPGSPGPITRWFASATSGVGHRPHRLHVRRDVVLELRVGELLG